MPSQTPVSLVVSVDTEEDNWGWASTAPYQCENARSLPSLVRFFERLGVRPTFFVTHAYLDDPYARGLIREMASEDWIEIGCHVHPWNTPPFDSQIPRRTMLYEYPRGLQRAKIGSLTRLIEEVTGKRPTSFRAGRFGFGALTAPVLLQEGYLVDSSVTPHWDWRQSSHGPSYLDAPLGVYRIKAGQDVLRHHRNGELVEVPLSSGYNRFDVETWPALTRTLEGGLARTVHLGGIAATLVGVRRVILSPEAYPLEDLVALGQRIVEGRVGHVQMFFHSSSLRPGLTPFTPAQADVDQLYHRLEAFLEAMAAVASLEPCTVTEASRTAGAEGPAPPGAGRAIPVHTGPTEGTTLRGFSGLREYGGLRVALGFVARYALARLGLYRRFRRVRWPDVQRIVFVCSGNICRSAYAEHCARDMGLPSVSIGVRTLAGKPASSMTMTVALERGVDLDHHRTTRIEDFEPEAGDLFVAMEPWHARAIQDHPEWSIPYQVTLLGLWIPGQGPVVLDPYGRSRACFAHCLSLIEAGVQGLEEARVEATQAQRSDQA